MKLGFLVLFIFSLAGERTFAAAVSPQRGPGVPAAVPQRGPEETGLREKCFQDLENGSIFDNKSTSYKVIRSDENHFSLVKMVNGKVQIYSMEGIVRLDGIACSTGKETNFIQEVRKDIEKLALQYKNSHSTDFTTMSVKDAAIKNCNLAFKDLNAPTLRSATATPPSSGHRQGGPGAHE